MNKIFSDDHEANNFVAGIYLSLAMSVLISLFDKFFPFCTSIGVIAHIVIAAICLVMVGAALLGRSVKLAITLTGMLLALLIFFGLGYYVGAHS